MHLGAAGGIATDEQVSDVMKHFDQLPAPTYDDSLNQDIYALVALICIASSICFFLYVYYLPNYNMTANYMNVAGEAAFVWAGVCVTLTVLIKVCRNHMCEYIT